MIALILAIFIAVFILPKAVLFMIAMFFFAKERLEEKIGNMAKEYVNKKSLLK